MSTTSHDLSAGRTARFGFLAAIMLPILYLLNGTAGLVDRLGLPRDLATTIVNLLVTHGAGFVVWLFPWLAPYISTLQELLRQGAQYAISF